MNNNLKSMYSSGNDEMYTPKILVEPIIPYIPTGSTVWCPCDTKSSEFVLTLREHDIKVIHSHIWEGKDFLTYEPDEHYDCIITNPPFSLKLDVFKRLVSLQKPFAILMNSTCEQYQVIGNYFWELSQKGIHIQKLTPDKKVSFNGKTSSFNTAYFCWNLLPRDNMYCHLAHNNAGKHYVPSRMHEDIVFDEDDAETEEVEDSIHRFPRGPPFIYLNILNSILIIRRIYEMAKKFNEYNCYEYKVNRHYYVLVIIKGSFAEFMMCKWGSNVHYWVYTDYLVGVNSVDEHIKTVIKRWSQQWIQMWKIRCNNDILSYDK